ncbi:hypothetical protein [Streptomyces asoensis]|uniref:hypothetical protein n=1 Tax=Streptomyces asoensis TaxID=249586 RepID=UPI00340C2DEA
MSKDTVAVLALVVASFSGLGTILNMSVSMATYLRVRPRVKLTPWYVWGRSKEGKAGKVGIELRIWNKGQHPIRLAQGFHVFIRDSSDVPNWTWFAPHMWPTYFRSRNFQALLGDTITHYSFVKSPQDEKSMEVPGFNAIDWSGIYDGEDLSFHAESGRSYKIRFMVRLSTGKDAFSRWYRLKLPDEVIQYLRESYGVAAIDDDVLEPFLRGEQ